MLTHYVQENSHAYAPSFSARARLDAHPDRPVHRRHRLPGPRHDRDHIHLSLAYANDACPGYEHARDGFVDAGDADADADAHEGGMTRELVSSPPSIFIRSPQNLVPRDFSRVAVTESAPRHSHSRCASGRFGVRDPFMHEDRVPHPRTCNAQRMQSGQIRPYLS
jgi:hypothetical protein